MSDSVTNLLPEIALAVALAWGAGLRLYAVLFLVGLAGHFGLVVLPGNLAILASPIVIAASGFMTLVEFLADKVPWIDSVWDAVHTFIRIPAGAALAAAVFGDNGPGVVIAAAILGGTVAAGSHLTKAGARSAVNTSPEPFTNWGLSFAEDVLVPVGLWLAIVHPVLFFVLIAVFAVGAFVLARWIASGLSRLIRQIRQTGSKPVAPE